MSEETQNPEVGYADGGDRVESAELKTQMIEGLITRFDELLDQRGRSYKNFLMTSLAWSYKYRMARSIIVLLDLNAGLVDAQEHDQQERTETLVSAIRRVENQIDELENIYKWAAAQSNPSLLPLNAGVIAGLQTEMETDDDIIKEYAEALQMTEEEAKAELEDVPTPDVERAIKYADPALVELERRTQGEYSEFTFNSWNAVTAMEKIAAKAETYMIRTISDYKQTRRKSHRARLLSNREALQKIMDEADSLAVKFSEDAEVELMRAQQTKSTPHEDDQPIMA